MEKKLVRVYRDNIQKHENVETMLSARIHRYQEPLVIDTIPRFTVAHGEEVLIKVGGSRTLS